MSESCRLCGGGTAMAFDARVLSKYQVAFYRCLECRSLQTEQPYWLQDAYSSAITALDTGAVGRNLICQAGITAIARTLHLGGRFFDFGGGSGLLCRLLRDRGCDAYFYDKYAEPLYARGFVLQPGVAQALSIDLVSAIEVFEHCERPDAQLSELFSIRPKVLVATTVPYEENGPAWWYLSLQTGQHVFFYSQRALKLVAKKFGYAYLNEGMFHIFSQNPLSVVQKIALKYSLSRMGLRLGRVWIAATQRGGCAEADHRSLSRMDDDVAVHASR